MVHRLIWICKIQWLCSLFPCLSGITLLSNLGPKNQTSQFKVKFGTYSNLNMQNSVVVFTFPVLDRKHRLWANLVQKIKIVSLSWNLVPRLIRIYRIQQWCSLFCFRWETPFLINKGKQSRIIVSETLK